MSTRSLVLGATLALVGLLAFLTLSVLVKEGFDVLVGLSLLILALMFFGVLGALTGPSSDE
jgi:hypothetical protein